MYCMYEGVGQMTEKELRFKAYEQLAKIYHELAPGEHSFHLCENCCSRPARRSKCYMCLFKEITDESK